MREPHLTADRFLRDEVLLREYILTAHDFARCAGAAFEADAVRFVSPSRLTLTLHPTITDLSRYDRLSLKIMSRTGAATLVGVTLRHGPEQESPHRRPISLSGGRESLSSGTWLDLRFPLESFGSYGAPKGWTDVREIELVFGRERTHIGPEDIDVSIEGLYGEIRRIPDGPRLTMDGLEAVLKTDCDKAAGSCAGFAFDEEFPDKRRPVAYTDLDPDFMIPPPHSYPLESPEDVLEGRIMGYPVGFPVKWDLDPLGMLEWTHFLNRHHFMRQLVKGIADAGKPAYAAGLDALVKHWIHTNPVPVGSNGGAGPAWETLSVAWRLREWLWVMGASWRRKGFTQETKLAMLRSVWEHARSLMDHQGHPNNWIIVESAALCLAGLCFPEFHEADEWLETGIARLRAEVERQFFRDGVHYEISPFYHAICLHALLEVKVAASEKGVELPPEFDTPLEKTTDYLAALCRPDFTWPSLNDSQGAFGDYSALMRLAGRIYDRPDLTWTGSRGREGKAPEKVGHLFPAAGICTMRSHYGQDAHFLVFRSGPPGAAHVHRDTLSLDVTALGQPRLVDPGITSYAPDPLTEHYRSAESHNTILINGKGVDQSKIGFRERVTPAEGRIHRTRQDGLEIVSGLCTGPWEGVEDQCTVVRTVMFVENEYWLIRDVVSGTGSLEITTCLQFAPGRVEMDHKTCILRFVDARGPGLLVIPLLGGLPYQVEIASGLTVPPIGWISSHGTDLPATSCRYTATIPASATLVWLLIPVFGKSADTVEAGRRDEDNTIRVEITFGQTHTDLISWKSGEVDLEMPHQAMSHEGIRFSRVGIRKSRS